MIKKSPYQWNFQRIGGIDQVIITSGDDIAHLDELDPKLWMVLSCPSSGLELDAKTLSLLDKNAEGRVRITDILDAINWLKARLINLDTLLNNRDELLFSVIDSENEDGNRILTTAKTILKNIHQDEKQSISLADLAKSATLNAKNFYNGDGIVPLTDKLEPPMQTFVKEAMSVMGALKDASGLDGINNAISQAFKSSLIKWLDWHSTVGDSSTVLGANTSQIWQLVQTLKPKIDDYFLRSQLASYAPQAAPSLNVNEKYIVPTDNGLLENTALSELPLSKIEADAPLSLSKGLNPIWQEQIKQFANLIKPLIADEDNLTRQEWLDIQDKLKPYAKAVLSKPALDKVDITTQPTMSIDSLGEARIHEILQSDLFDKFAVLAENDSKIPAPAADIAEVEKLVILNKNLYHLLRNFVSFNDFFHHKNKAAFQSGSLFIDGRCCSLCLYINDVNQHITLSNYSELYLLYCECTRIDPKLNSAPQKKRIVAAVTAGDADFLLEGRNGVFVDNAGHDWDAKVIKIISKPISLYQAVWDPYKRIGRFITEQINKWANSKDSAMMESATKKIQPADPATKFDIGKNVGIFAAIGLAIGAIGTAIASIASSLFQLAWWQVPLVFLGLFIIISGPSVIIAWLKLRQRTLAPLLEASGWALNSKIKISTLLGRRLTAQAKLPANAKRNLKDPTKKSNTRFHAISLLVILVCALAASYWFWNEKQASNEVNPTDHTQVIKSDTETNEQ